MGTAGRSGAPTGRGTHSRSELPHPTSPHLATSNFQQLLKKAKILHFLADFGGLSWLAVAGSGASSVSRAAALIAQ